MGWSSPARRSARSGFIPSKPEPTKDRSRQPPESTPAAFFRSSGGFRLIVFGERAMNGVTMTTTERTATRSKRQTIDNTQELRDALFHAICFLDHANPENDTDHRDVAAARELAKLRESLNR